MASSAPKRNYQVIHKGQMTRVSTLVGLPANRTVNALTDGKTSWDDYYGRDAAYDACCKANLARLKGLMDSKQIPEVTKIERAAAFHIYPKDARYYDRLLDATEKNGNEALVVLQYDVSSNIFTYKCVIETINESIQRERWTQAWLYVLTSMNKRMGDGSDLKLPFRRDPGDDTLTDDHWIDGIMFPWDFDTYKLRSTMHLMDGLLSKVDAAIGAILRPTGWYSAFTVSSLAKSYARTEIKKRLVPPEEETKAEESEDDDAVIEAEEVIDDEDVYVGPSVIDINSLSSDDLPLSRRMSRYIPPPRTAVPAPSTNPVRLFGRGPSRGNSSLYGKPTAVKVK